MSATRVFLIYLTVDLFVIGGALPNRGRRFHQSQTWRHHEVTTSFRRAFPVAAILALVCGPILSHILLIGYL